MKYNMASLRTWIQCCPWRTLTPAFACIAAVSACSIGSSGDADSLVIADQRAATANELSRWTPWNMPLALCVVRGEIDASKPGYFNDADFVTYSQRVLTVAQDSWGRVPGISFTADCNASQHLTIQIFADPGGGVCGYGVGAVCQIRPVGNDGQIVHELGHGLGMFHEHQRTDAFLCTNEQNLIDAWMRCVAAYDASPQQACTAADYNLIFAPNPPVAGPIVISAAERQRIVDNYANNLPDSTALGLTPYDPLSIMNYCSVDFGRTGYIPTPWDLLGMEMLYPLNSGHRLSCRDGCFNTSSGVIVRSDGVVTSDWTARGALNVPMALTSASATSATTINASALPAGMSSVSYDFLDPRGNHHPGSGTAVKSDAAHAAIMLSTFVL